MANKPDVVATKRFFFRDCLHKPAAYRAVARVAGFSSDMIRGRMVVDIKLLSKPTPRRRKGTTRRTGASKTRRSSRG